MPKTPGSKSSIDGILSSAHRTMQDYVNTAKKMGSKTPERKTRRQSRYSMSKRPSKKSPIAGGKKTKRSGKKARKSRTHKKRGGTDTAPDTASVTAPKTTPETASDTASETAPSTLTKFYRATHQLVRGKKSAGEICEDVRDNYIRIDGTRLTDYWSRLKEQRSKSFLADTVFYAHTFHAGCNLHELGKLLLRMPFKAKYDEIRVPNYRSVKGEYTDITQKFQYIKFTEVVDGYGAYSEPTGLGEAPYNEPYLGYGKGKQQRNLTGYKQSTIFYIKKEDFKEEKLDEKDKEVFNELKVKEKEDPYLKLATFDNSPNYYRETWLVRYQLYEFVPTIYEYNENQVNYYKKYY